VIYEITITAPDGTAKTHSVEITRVANGERYLCRVDGGAIELDSSLPEPGVLSLIVGGKSHEIRLDGVAGETLIVFDGKRYSAEIRDPRSLRGRKGKAGASDGPKKITAPMPGKVVRILAQVNSEVEAGQGVVVIEAMKMQNELKSPKKGTLKKIMAVEGATVNAGDTLAIVD
jgi:biotin carboxyl carrier protein